MLERSIFLAVGTISPIAESVIKTSGGSVETIQAIPQILLVKLPPRSEVGKDPIHNLNVIRLYDVNGKCYEFVYTAKFNVAECSISHQ